MTYTRTGTKKTVYLSNLWNDTVRDYAKKTGLSQSDTIERLMLLGDSEFRKRYGLDLELKRSEAQNREDAVRQQRAKREKDWQEAREKRLKDIVLGSDNVDEELWTRLD